MATTHIRIQNVILLKRYVRDMQFEVNATANTCVLHVVYMGGRKDSFALDTVPTAQQISGYKAELEDR